jgi:ribonuclease D
LLNNPKIEKVIHGAENDISLMKRDFRFSFEGIFDTQIAARFLGRSEIGLRAMVEQEFQVRLSKKQQKGDWARRPLTPMQQQYATDDVNYLIALRDRLLGELRGMGRESWVREECEALILTPAAKVRETSAFLEIRGARDLDARELSVLRELFLLREGWAQRSDRPVFRVLCDNALLHLAVQRPRRSRSLRSVPDLPDRIRHTHAGEILSAIRRGEAVPETACPRFPPPQGRRKSALDEKRSDRLKEWRQHAAAEVGLDPGLLLPQRIIERIARHVPKQVSELEQIEGIRRWRVETFGEAICLALNS